MPGGGGPGNEPPAHLVRKPCDPPCTPEQCNETYNIFEAAYQTCGTNVVCKASVQTAYDNAPNC